MATKLNNNDDDDIKEEQGKKIFFMYVRINMYVNNIKRIFKQTTGTLNRMQMNFTKQ